MKTIGSLGTKYTMTQDFYMEKLLETGFEVLIPVEVTYYTAHTKFCKKLIDYFNSLNAPTHATKIHDENNYYINELNSDLARASDYKEKITILKEQLNKMN
ncbi:hypothetical protein JOC28_000776 [Streptococcus loxodontisalivarius]|uniref:Uncharacterized protein n=1 Tax=Streptococcus loxodontisalivarius TaxID=1349415 RepID=A0ABS2PR07_9STRE|nr:hypothetical protein [Streptococcus loxodontisalivarius]